MTSRRTSSARSGSAPMASRSSSVTPRRDRVEPEDAHPRRHHARRVAQERDLRAVTELDDRVRPGVEREPVAVVALELERGPVVHVEHHLAHRDVEVLTAASRGALQQRREHRVRRHHARVDVAVDLHLLLRALTSEPAAHLDGAGLGVHHRCVGRAVAPRSVLAPAGDGAVDEARDSAEQVVGTEARDARAHRVGSSPPARRRASASSARSSAPRGCLMSTQTLRFPAFICAKYVPGLPGATIRVVSSVGGSIFTTSAPRSARMRPHIGPETMRERSRTRTPASGRGSSAAAGIALTLRSTSWTHRCWPTCAPSTPCWTRSWRRTTSRSGTHRRRPSGWSVTDTDRAPLGVGARRDRERARRHRSAVRRARDTRDARTATSCSPRGARPARRRSPRSPTSTTATACRGAVGTWRRGHSPPRV